MGLVRVRGGVASTVGDRRSYVWVATGDGYWGLAYQGRVASMVVDRASPVFSADEDVHNPSVDGLGTSWGVVASTVGDRRSYAWVATEDGYWGLAYQGRLASTVVDRASPVFSADEDVHNPSVDGLGTSWGRGCFNGRRPSLLRGSGSLRAINFCFDKSEIHVLSALGVCCRMDFLSALFSWKSRQELCFPFF